MNFEYLLLLIYLIIPDPSGSRLISGGYDSVIKFWDFNAMDSSLKSFRTIEPETDVITSLEYSPTGDKFIMVCSKKKE